MIGDCDPMSMRLTLVSALMLCLVAAGRKDHTPEMSYLDNGVVKLGVDLNLGGAVTYLSRAKEDFNIINSWDWGRQVQMSYYSGPVPFMPKGKEPAPQWRGLGWNPVQAGDHFGNSSKTIEHTNDGKTIYVKCVPMQWPLNNEPLEGTFETWYELDGSAVKVRARLNNARSDKTQWPGRMQELPAVYTNGPFYRLMTYSGEKPFTGAELTRVEHFLTPKDPWAHWFASENWAALVSDEEWGLGVWNPSCYQFSGGFAGKPGKGGASDDPTGYIAPNRAEILDHDIQHEFEYTLILGDLKSIRDYVYAHAKRPAPPAYRFEKDRQGWRYVNARDAGWPIKGELEVRLEGDDPQMVGPAGFWQAADAPVLYIRAAFQTKLKTAQVMWSCWGERDAKHAMDLAIVPDGAYRTYALRLADSPEYKGVITGLRFDPVASGAKGEWVRVKSIGFEKVE
jgi:hypothetical protein